MLNKTNYQCGTKTQYYTCTGGEVWENERCRPAPVAVACRLSIRLRVGCVYVHYVIARDRLLIIFRLPC